MSDLRELLYLRDLPNWGMDLICGGQSNKVGTCKFQQLQHLSFCLVYGYGHLPRTPLKQIFGFSHFAASHI